MTTNMITAARLLAHKTINGRYRSLLALDKFPVLGHQMVSFVFFFFLTFLKTDGGLKLGDWEV